MTTSGTTTDNYWQRVITNDKWQRVTANVNERSFPLMFFFCQPCGVGMNILKTKKSFLITSEAIAAIAADVFKICKFIHSLSLDVLFAGLCINNLRELYKRYPQLTTGHCIEMRSGSSVVHVFFVWSNQFYISDWQF